MMNLRPPARTRIERQSVFHNCAGPVRAGLFGVLLIIVSAGIPVESLAQGSAPADGPVEHSIGPPLRNNILFSYIRTERVRMAIATEGSDDLDSSERVLTYYITQRQRPSTSRAGAFDIETNIDSMLVSYRGPGGDILFNTQSIEDAGDVDRVRHPAVLVPSALVNSVAHLTISPYGSLVGIRSESVESLREQAENPHLDDFTYKRLDHMLADRYLTTVMFPWGNFLPLGRTVPYGIPTDIVVTTSIDRIVLDATASVIVTPSDEDARKPTMTISADLASKPENEWITYDATSAPVLIREVDGSLSGLFELDQDGVVLNGATTAAAKVTGSARGRAITADIRHEVFVELVGMTAFDISTDR